MSDQASTTTFHLRAVRLFYADLSEPRELIAVQGLEGALGERAENEVAFLRPAMPAPKQ